MIYHDLAHVLEVPDILATAARLGSLNWSRDGSLLTELVVERETKEGGTELVLNTAGASAKREMVKIIRKELGIDKMLEAVKASSEAQENQDD